MTADEVSVVIPTHERREFVLEAVASVLGQTTPPGEVIVVDDASTDGTAEAIEARHPEVRVLRREARGGVSAARNDGIRAARGTWIALLDSDDLWRPRKLERQLAHLEASPHLRIAQTEEVWLRNGKHLNPRKVHRKPQGHCFEALLERCLVSPSAVIIHRSLFGEAGLFDETLPACEDYDLWLRIGCRHPVGLLEEALIVKRGGHADQLSATVEALDLYRIRALANLLRSAPLDTGQRLAALAILNRKCRIYATGCGKRGKTEEAAAILAIPEEFGVESPRE